MLLSFSQLGCFRSNLDQVADVANIGKGTIYRRYGSKEELLTDALESGIDALIARCTAAYDVDPSGSLPGLVAELLAMNRQQQPGAPGVLDRLACCLRWSGVSLDPTVISSRLAPFVRGWQARGVLRRDADATWVAGVLLALVNAPETATAGEAERVVEVLLRTFGQAR